MRGHAFRLLDMQLDGFHLRGTQQSVHQLKDDVTLKQIEDGEGDQSHDHSALVYTQMLAGASTDIMSVACVLSMPAPYRYTSG